jgi:hypothetical protein
MPKKVAKGDQIVEDNGWCDFKATPEYRKNFYNIFGNTCTKCKKGKAAEGKIWCAKCEEAE